MDNNFAFVHAVFHVILFALIHSRREQRRRQRRVPPAPRHWTRNSITLNQRKSHEARSPLSKPIALSQELQTKSYPNQAGEAELCFSSGAFRSEAANQNI